MSRTVTATNLNGDCERVSLPEPFWGDHDGGPTGGEDSTGVWYIALYYGPRSHRAFIQTYSIWDNGHGCMTGTAFSEIGEASLLHFCNKVGCEPPDITPTEIE